VNHHIILFEQNLLLVQILLRACSYLVVVWNNLLALISCW